MRVIDNVEKILAIELLTAAQAFEYRKPMKSGPILDEIHKMVRTKVSFAEKDRVFSDDIEKFIPPKKGKQHILRIIRELINFEPTGKSTEIASALEYFNNVIKKRSICFLMSDFFVLI